jgi:hypothetical protein
MVRRFFLKLILIALPIAGKAKLFRRGRAIKPIHAERVFRLKPANEP